MKTQSVYSWDGTRIAFDLCGDGPALIWLSAMLAWRSIEPSEMLCPTLWVVGSKNEGAMASVADYGDRLHSTKVQVEILDGLNHSQEFLEIERTLPILIRFTTKGGD